MKLAPGASTLGENQILARKAQSGDLEAFDRLVDRYYLRVYRLLYRLLSHPEEAEDAAQEVLIAAWENLPRFRGDSSFATWLHSVAVRRGLASARKRERRRTVPLEGDLLEESPADPSINPSIVLANREERERVRKAVARLPEQQRLVVALYYYGEVPCRVIAEELGMQESTVRGHLRRARETLRHLLPQEGGDSP